jgi:hypothetical protein
MLLRTKSMLQRLSVIAPVATLGALCGVAAHAGESEFECLAGGGGRLEMRISGEFEASVDWGNDGTRCEGGPRPDGDALRLMFSRDDDGLLVVLGITGLERGATGAGLLANLTIVRQGMGRFYGSLGADACIVEVRENVAESADPDSFRVSGQGRCEAPIDAIAREGAIRVAPFEFTGKAYWPDGEY